MDKEYGVQTVSDVRYQRWTHFFIEDITTLKLQKWNYVATKCVEQIKSILGVLQLHG